MLFGGKPEFRYGPFQRSSSGSVLTSTARSTAFARGQTFRSSRKTASFLVEAIGRNSNLGHLCKKWAELRKRINDAVTDIVRRYEGGETAQHVGKRYGISKTRVASILTYHGVPIRRQGLNEEQVNEAARLYIAGKSLAWIGAVYGVSHTTVAAALRRKDVELRPRPGWV